MSASEHQADRVRAWPSLAFDDSGLALAIGAAGATRLKTALSTVLAGVLEEGLDPEDAVSRPRIHPTPDVVDAEPGVDETALEELEAQKDIAFAADIDV